MCASQRERGVRALPKGTHRSSHGRQNGAYIERTHPADYKARDMVFAEWKRGNKAALFRLLRKSWKVSSATEIFA